MVLRKSESSAVLETYQLDKEHVTKNKTVSLEGHEKFFLSIKNFEDDGMRNLHKRWFDNMKDYLERKEARLEKEKSKSSSASCAVNLSPVPIKKQKFETWCKMHFFQRW